MIPSACGNKEKTQYSFSCFEGQAQPSDFFGSLLSLKQPSGQTLIFVRIPNASEFTFPAASGAEASTPGVL